MNMNDKNIDGEEYGVKYFDGIRLLNEAVEENNIKVTLNLGNVKNIIQIIHETGFYKCRMEYHSDKSNQQNDTVVVRVLDNNSSERIIAKLEYKIYPEQVLTSFKLYDTSYNLRYILIHHLIAALAIY